MSEEAFEIRGQHPHTRLPVRRCRACGSWFTVRARGYVLPFLGWKADKIGWDLRQQMEEIWERSFGKDDPTKRATCPECSKAFATEAGMHEHLAAKHPSAV
jgi:hypothetical protein